MVNLEHIRLLETKITKAIDYVKKVNDENSLLRGKLGSYQKRIDELEVLVQQFKEDQGRIEDGILSALDRLNQFEDAIEQSLSQGKSEAGAAHVKADKPVVPKSAPQSSAAPQTRPAKNPAGEETTEEAEVALVEDVSPKPEESDPVPENGELDIF